MRASFYSYVILYLPWLASLLLENNPVASYFTAWLGSFWIFYLSIFGKIQPIPKDLPMIGQLMRPLFITQLIFAGYLAVSSIFFFLDINGYYFLNFDYNREINKQLIALTAQCQRYYCLAHASFTCGILLAMDYSKPLKWKVTTLISNSNLFLLLSLVFTVLALIMKMLPGMMQFAIKLGQLSFVGAVLSLALAIPEGKPTNIAIAATIFAINMVNAFLSGWKEQILVPLIMLGVYLYPYYKRTVTLIFPALIILFFVFIPTYNKVFRGLAWFGETNSEAAATLAFEAIRSGEEDLKANNWYFLTMRLSEVSMFVEYVERVPNEIDFYGFTIVRQAIESMIPRVLWKEKPSTEQLVMERVYEIGVVSRDSIISAKPPLVTDGYLSGGAFAIFILSLLLGYTASSISVLCENLFGGYLYGTALMYTGLFQIFWRGNCFEFMLNYVFWGVVLLYILFFLGKKVGVISRNKTYVPL